MKFTCTWGNSLMVNKFGWIIHKKKQMSQIKMLQIVNWFKKYFFRSHSVVKILQLPIRIVSPAQNRVTNIYILGFVCFGAFFEILFNKKYDNKLMFLGISPKQYPIYLVDWFLHLMLLAVVDCLCWWSSRTGPQEKDIVEGYCSCAQLNDNNPYIF